MRIKICPVCSRFFRIARWAEHKKFEDHDIAWICATEFPTSDEDRKKHMDYVVHEIVHDEFKKLESEKEDE